MRAAGYPLILRLIYEKRVSTLAGLRKELRTLDGDAGIRISGAYGGRSCLAFVTRFGRTYTVIVYAVKGATGRASAEMLASKEFIEVDGAVAFLTQMATPKVEAYVY